MSNSREAIYDVQVTPLMTQIIAICKEHDIPLHATFKLDDDDVCSTHLEGTDRSAQMRMFYYLAKAGDNFDNFMIAVMRDAEQHGHNSAFIHLLDNKLAEAGGQHD